MFCSKVDFNIKNLDYQNKALIEKENFFKTNLNQNKMVAILITADSCDDLIENAKIVKSLDSKSLSPLPITLSKDITRKA